jgi:flagellar basal-body rod protein FlgC
MPLHNVFNIAGSAMTAQSQRLNVVASNLANVESVTGPHGQPYRAKQVVFGAWMLPAQHAPAGAGAMPGAEGVEVTRVIEDPSPMRRVYEPGHPLADEQGYLTMPNVNIVDEMVNMISASRSYQNSVDMMNAAKSLLLKTLTLGQ